MKLLTKEILQRFAKAGSQEDVFDALIICKFFDPCSSRTRYATEYDQARGIFFGYVVGEFSEWWTFSLLELMDYKWPLGIGIERDMHFTPRRFSELNLL